MVDDYLARHLQCVTRALRRHKRIAIPIAAHPRTKRKNARQFALLKPQTINVAKRVNHLAIDLRQSIKQRHRIRIQAHANLIRHARLAEPHFVGLPESCDLSADLPLQFLSVRIRKRQTIEVLEKASDVQPLAEHGSTCHFRRMRRKYRSDFNLS